MGPDDATAPTAILSPSPDDAWWRPTRLEANSRCRWRLGPLRLIVERTTVEWRIGARTDGDAMDETLEAAIEAASTPLDAEEIGWGWSRFATSSTADTLTICPLMADRPVVVRPIEQTTLLPHEEVTFYVSSPAWIGVRAGAPAVALREVASWRPSDTWFGGTTGGELCYASRSRGRRELDPVEQSRMRPITPLVLANPTDAPLDITRVSLPAPNLTIFADDAHQLWTESVRLVAGADAGLAHVELARQAPAEAAGAVRVCEPRVPMAGGFTARAFAGLLDRFLS